MKNAKFTKLLYPLSKEELRAFEMFLKEKCQSANKTFPKIIRFFRNFHQNFDSKKFTAQHLFEKLYPTENFDKKGLKKIQNALSELKHYFEEFLIWQALNKNDYLKSKLLIQEFAHLGLNEQFYKTAKDFNNSLAQKAPFSEADYLNLYQIKRDFFFNLSTEKLTNLQTRLPEILDHIHHFHNLTMLKYGLEILNRNKSLKTPEILPNSFEETFLRLHNQSEKTLPTTILAYLKLAELYQATTVSPQFFEAINSFCKNNFEQIAAAERSVIFGYLRNFVKQQYFEKQLNAKEKLFELLEFSLEKKLLLVDNYFPYARFINLVLLAVEFKNLNWVKQFVKRYQPTIQSDFREDTKNYIDCYLLFIERKYTAASKLSSKINIKKAGINFIFRSLVVRVHYELAKAEKNHVSVLDSYLLACRRYFHRNKILGDKKEKSYKNFIEMTRKLSYYRFQKTPTKQNIKTLKKRFANYSFLTLEDWLHQQIKDLELHQLKKLGQKQTSSRP